MGKGGAQVSIKRVLQERENVRTDSSVSNTAEQRPWASREGRNEEKTAVGEKGRILGVGWRERKKGEQLDFCSVGWMEREEMEAWMKRTEPSAAARPDRRRCTNARLPDAPIVDLPFSIFYLS